METRRVGTEDFRRRLSDLLNQVYYGNERVIIEKHGKPIAVLLPYGFYEKFEDLVGTSIHAEPSPLVEQVPGLVSELQQAFQDADFTYEMLADRLREERLRTLKEKYPDFVAEFGPKDVTPEPS